MNYPARVLAGPWLLIFVCTIVSLAAVALGARLYGERRSEQAFATGVLFALGIALPVHILGWASQLTRMNLARATFALAAVALVSALWGVPAPHRFLLGALGRCLRLPLDALVLALRARSVVALGLIGTFGVIAWTAFLSYLAPASGWDGLWYHDSMVGFAIQNRGFAVERSLPPWHALIDGYTRGSEYFNLFPVLLWDRRLIELAPSVFAAIALPGLDALFARFGLKPPLRLGLACAYVLIPAIALQLRSTYIDVQVAVVYLAALYFATQPALKLRDAILATLSLALLCNAKSSGLPLAIIVFGFFGLRVLLRFGRRAPVQTMLGLTTALIVIGLLGGLTFLRNYMLHKNPLYPLVVHSERLHIHWDGPGPVQFHDDFHALRQQLVSPPIADHEWPDTRTNGYGNGPPFIVLPGALIALALWSFHWLRAAYRRERPAAELVNLSWVVLLTACTIPLSPSWTWARFNLHIVLGGFCLFAWWLGRERAGSWGEGAVGALLFTSFLTLLWSRPGWGVPPALARELWSKPPEERATTQIVDFMLPTATAAAREAELKKGDVVAVDWSLDFISLAWNERYSNRLRLLDADDAVTAVAALQRMRPTWAIVRPGSELGKVLVADPAQWQRVGVVRAEFVAFRRMRHRN